MSNGLFRTEAMTADDSAGRVIVSLPAVLWWVSLAIPVIVVAGIGILGLADVDDRVTVRGFVEQTVAPAKVFAPVVGSVSAVLRVEGDVVEEGDVLLTITGADRFVVASLQRSKRKERELLQRRLGTQRRLAQMNAASAAHELDEIARLIAATKQSERLAAKRVELAEANYRRLTQLAQAGQVSEVELALGADRRLEALQAVSSIRRDAARQGLERARWQSLSSRQPFEVAASESLLRERLLRVEQELIDLRARRAIDVVAPRAGRVVDLLVHRGQRTEPQRPLLTLLSQSHGFEVILLVSSRAVGRIRTGQTVRVRFDAFPYQRYGVGEGEVVSVADAPYRPQDLALPITLAEPSFRVVVAVADTGLALRSGLALEADVLVDRRALWTWIVDPVRRLGLSV